MSPYNIQRLQIIPYYGFEAKVILGNRRAYGLGFFYYTLIVIGWEKGGGNWRV